MADRKRKKKEDEKPVKPFNAVPLMPVMAIVGFIIGFFICWLTFVHLGGN